MKLLRQVIIASFMAMGATTLISAPVFAQEKKAEKKCTKDGKECKEGDKDCAAANCKGEKK
jgi:hypothetical protein